MRTKIVSILKKDKEIVDLKTDAVIDNNLNIAEYSVSIPVSEFNRDKKAFKTYIDKVVNKFYQAVKLKKNNDSTFLNFHNRDLVNDLREHGVLYYYEDDIIGLNIKIKNKDIKMTTILNEKDSKELIELADSSSSVEETLEKINRSKLKNKIEDNTKISQIKPEKIIVELFCVL